jgi:hypothetical protein
MTLRTARGPAFDLMAALPGGAAADTSATALLAFSRFYRRNWEDKMVNTVVGPRRMPKYRDIVLWCMCALKGTNMERVQDLQILLDAAVQVEGGLLRWKTGFPMMVLGPGQKNGIAVRRCSKWIMTTVSPTHIGTLPPGMVIDLPRHLNAATTCATTGRPKGWLSPASVTARRHPQKTSCIKRKRVPAGRRMPPDRGKKNANEGVWV